MNEQRTMDWEKDSRKADSGKRTPHGSKLRNEESRSRYYRSKVRSGKADTKGELLSEHSGKSSKRTIQKRMVQETGRKAIRKQVEKAAYGEADTEQNQSSREVIRAGEDSIHSAYLKGSSYLRKLQKRSRTADAAEEAERGPVSNFASKQLQKQRLKREMMAARRKAEKEAANSAGSLSRKFVDKAEDLGGKAMEWVLEQLAEHPMGIMMTVGFGILLMVVASTFSSCSMMAGGVSNVTIASSYTAEDATIRQVDGDYIAMEDHLRRDIDNIESDYPDYDEYRYDLSEINHNSHHLAALLTVLYEDYTREEARGKLQEIFQKQYTLTLTPITEIRTRTETRTGHSTSYNEDGSVDEDTYTYEVEVEYEYRILKVKLTNTDINSLVSGLGLTTDQMERYQLLLTTYGNKEALFGNNVYNVQTLGEFSDYDVAPEALTDQKFARMVQEGEKYLGREYVWGGSSPSTGFDCSGFMSWVINHSGNGWNFGRLTANGLLGKCTRISSAEAKPGDLIFFQGTYNTRGASHVGLYVGNGMMLHCGNPIQYTSIHSNYWTQHFYTFGRLP